MVNPGFSASHYRQLGNNGPHVSPLGLGTVKFGRNQGVKYPEAFEIPDRQTLAALLDHAQALGINLLDTAPAYGSSEEVLGDLLDSQRDRWVLSGKVGETFVNGQSHYDFSVAAIRASVEASLLRLKTDRLDVLLLHSNGQDQAVLNDDVIRELERLKSRGLTVQTGASVKTEDGVQRVMATLDVVMLELGDVSTGILQAAEANGTGVLVKKALSSGHASDPGARLQHALAQPGVNAVIVGTINSEHLASNVADVLLS